MVDKWFGSPGGLNNFSTFGLEYEVFTRFCKEKKKKMNADN